MTTESITQVRLLLVDDEDDFRQALKRRLEKRGIVTFEANDGSTCLDVLARQPVDVVVMDVKMPGMGGIETLNRIKAAYSDTEVILLTGHAATEDGVAGIKAGAFDYLTKPVSFEHLLGKMNQAYDKIMAKKQREAAAEFKIRMEQQMVATERLAALGTLAAGVAHEINNPLAIIYEAAGYLASRLKKDIHINNPDKAAFESALEKIANSVKRARAITHQLLSSVGKSETLLSEVDGAGLIAETVQLFQQQVKEKGIELILSADEKTHPIWTDPNRIRQVLINLVSNAIHATDRGGSVIVDVRSESGGICLSVRDTGSGIPKENLEKIFEPFFSTKMPGQGTGLGLFVTREILEKLGGTIVVSSKIGHGTTFTVHIPDQGVEKSKSRP